MKNEIHKNSGSTFQPFNKDVTDNSGYLYTTAAKLSSRLANKRLSDATLCALSFEGKRVIDIGCGDGTYTIELFDRANPTTICGIDPAEKAIEIATTKVENRPISFTTASAYKLPFDDRSFDIAHLRGVLHHMDDPAQALKEAFRVASNVIVIEPNGYNPILKLIEHFSKYHIDHEEKSYPPHRLDRWVNQHGGRVVSKRMIGLVPFFCPDSAAYFLKLIEPLAENIPLINLLSCAVYVQVSHTQ